MGSRSAHYCRLRHGQRCVRAGDLGSLASPLAYLGTAGRLGNAMSTLAILLATRSRGFTPLIDLANYQVGARGHRIYFCYNNSLLVSTSVMVNFDCCSDNLLDFTH